jgi:hypothetical protein
VALQITAGLQFAVLQRRGIANHGNVGARGIVDPTLQLAAMANNALQRAKIILFFFLFYSGNFKSFQSSSCVQERER